MRDFTIVALLAATSLLGSKCDKPKGPKAQAIETVEQAWAIGAVADELSEVDETAVTVERFEEEPIEVHFWRAGIGSEAELAFPAGSRFRCWLDDVGEVDECVPSERSDEEAW